MIDILKAESSHVAGIAHVCSDAYWATYHEIRSEEYINRIIKEFCLSPPIDELMRLRLLYGAFLQRNCCENRQDGKLLPGEFLSDERAAKKGVSL